MRSSVVEQKVHWLVVVDLPFFGNFLAEFGEEVLELILRSFASKVKVGTYTIPDRPKHRDAFSARRVERERNLILAR